MKKVYVFSDIRTLPEGEKMAAIATLLTEWDREYVSLAELQAANVQFMPMLENFVSSFGSHCRDKTKRMLNRITPSNLGYSGLLGRVTLNFNKDIQTFTGWYYVAGQDYRQEITQVRKALIG